MTGTGTTTTEGQNHHEATIAHLDPSQLLIGENVRDLPALSEAFVSSVREHGVLQPITALRDTATGEVTVLDGQLRTLAAREAGLATIPVYLRDDTTTDTKAAVATRVAHQIVTNDQRRALTTPNEPAASSRCSTRVSPSPKSPNVLLCPRTPSPRHAP